MKAKHTILIIALGFALDYLASLSRLFHRTEASTVLVIAAILKVVGVLWLAFKVVQYEGFRKFMNK